MTDKEVKRQTTEIYDHLMSLTEKLQPRDEVIAAALKATGQIMQGKIISEAIKPY